MEAEIVVKFLMRNSPQYFAFGTTRQDAASLMSRFASGALEPFIHRDAEAGIFVVRVDDVAAIHTEPPPRQNVPNAPAGVGGPVGRLGAGTSGIQR